MNNKNICSKQELEDLYKIKDLPDIYEIRYESLERKLNKEEFAKVLIHLAQRRGFKSNRKYEAKESEFKKSKSKESESESKKVGKLLNAVKENKDLLTDKSYRTIGEMIYKDEKFNSNKRNKADDYSNTYERVMLVEEIKVIFKAQQEFENEFATDDLLEKYIDIYTGQRSFEEGPASGKYSGNQIEKMLGKCTFLDNEERAAKASYSFEYASLLQKINNIRIVNQGNKKELEQDYKSKIAQLAHKTKD
ncbi:MAG: hypothetical protein RSB96_01810 [Oscillospiraceae bacterium]